MGGRELRLFRGNDGGAGEGGEEGRLVGVADRDAGSGDQDVVALDGFDFVETDYERFVDSDEIGCGEGVLEGFHPHKGENWGRVACQVDLHIVFQAFDVGDLVEVDLLEAVLGSAGEASLEREERSLRGVGFHLLYGQRLVIDYDATYRFHHPT